MKIKSIICLVLFVGTAFASMAQTYEFDNVRKYRPRGTGEIMKDGAVQGYYGLFPIEKQDRKNTTFQINILDNNLKFASSFEITRPKKYFLMTSSFNDEAFIFQFYDPKTRSYEFTTFDRTGKELSSINTEKLNPLELQYTVEFIKDENNESGNLYVNGSDGFMTIIKEKNKKLGYSVSAYDNNLKKRWTYGSDAGASLHEMTEVLFVDDKYVMMSVSKRKNAMTKKFDTFLVMLDAKTGKEYYNFQMQDNNEAQLSVLNAFMIDESGESYVVGEYYAPDDDILKDKSMGMYIRGVERNGEYSVFKKFSWDGDVARVISGNEDEEDKKDKMLIFFHNFVRTDGGHIYAFAEKYRKQVSALGTASVALAALGGGSSNASAMELKITDMVVMEFDTKLDLVKYTIVPKKRSRVTLPSGAGFLSPQALGQYVNFTGGFDYSYTSNDRVNDSYTAVYKDMNRREDDSKEKADVMIGSINLQSGTLTSDRFPVNSDANAMSIRRAKPGYIMISEYFRKAKKVTYRLEKINI